MISSDPVILGIVASTLGAIFYTSQQQHVFWQKLYQYIPVMVMCYFLPSLFNAFGLIDTSNSQLASIASRYIMPVCLCLLIISVDVHSLLQLGPKLIILFLIGAVGIVVGGPLTLMLFAYFVPETLPWNGADAVWKGMATLAGNWVGGTANQLAMKEVFQVGDNIFSIMITVNVVFSALWMSFLLFCANHSAKIDVWLQADTHQIEKLQQSACHLKTSTKKVPSLNDYMSIFAVGFGVMGLGHGVADFLAPFFSHHYPALARLSFTSEFFWIVIVVSLVSFGLSFTKVRQLEAVGASKTSSLMLYFLIAIMGLQMDVTSIADFPIYFLIGAIWLLFHAILVVIVGCMMRAPVAYMAIASQCNLGGAASSPVVAIAFHKSFAPVAVLLSVFGYCVATYMAWLCGELLKAVTP
ncbi:DUF819 family protein [Shewanella youngdeokensis]|uniref:DUF819 family protein n=1 Tax=Shewanella youngdeokensis TaxID=2999068 RepID=A0ABZ0K081_9GAMM|nr:DUF819 family protein [Shewanella sp. DAU334]